ncbi:hypothetical protein BaRGS_00038942 [Batillaria attramentaria]|uniref:Uncharacterized protein n=1 Tax=Batillaria attramentaria TaxID=370345 RepID=A0ABD0J5E0_9CAEN
MRTVSQISSRVTAVETGSTMCTNVQHTTISYALNRKQYILQALDFRFARCGRGALSTMSAAALCMGRVHVEHKPVIIAYTSLRCRLLGVVYPLHEKGSAKKTKFGSSGGFG